MSFEGRGVPIVVGAESAAGMPAPTVVYRCTRQRSATPPPPSPPHAPTGFASSGCPWCSCGWVGDERGLRGPGRPVRSGGCRSHVGLRRRFGSTRRAPAVHSSTTAGMCRGPTHPPAASAARLTLVVTKLSQLECGPPIGDAVRQAALPACSPSTKAAVMASLNSGIRPVTSALGAAPVHEAPCTSARATPGKLRRRIEADSSATRS